eukprot:GHVS01083755.1.p1 GENE.GHVS01083755.1~~GHVS01083755.1.p1  ORF type:complete len:167 (-),score=7.80 GHVS01083755.1:234-734(-)
MPGDGDPTNHSLPQQPLAQVLFSQAKRFKSFQSVTNPYRFELDGVRFLGCSGQAVEDICKFSDLDELGALKLVAECRCIAPTAPDTLPSYPFKSKDPFSMEEDDFPNVIFSANHREYKSCRLESESGEKGALLVCVPTFQLDGAVVLVDLYDLSVNLVRLGATTVQ